MTNKPITILSLQYYSYPDAVGGAWGWTHQVNRRLADRGHQVHLITCKPDDSLPNKECVDGVHYSRIGTRASKSPLSLFREIGNRVRAIKRETDIGLVHIHNPLIGFLACLVPELWRVPKAYHFHSSWLDEEKVNREGLNQRCGGLKLCLIRAMEWTCFGLSDCILFLSQYSRERFREYCPWKKSWKEIVSGGVDIDAYRPAENAEDRNALRRELGWPESGPILLTVRRLEARMGLENLLKALADVKRRRPDLPFFMVMAGKGSLAEKLNSLVEELGLRDQVQLPGLVPAERLPLYYRCADLFVLPTSAIEGFGLATVEALASGTPVMGTPVGGTVEILSAIDSRLLFKGIEAGSIADGIEDYLDDPAPIESLRAACRTRAAENYSWEQVTDSIEKIFHELTAPQNA